MKKSLRKGPAAKDNGVIDEILSQMPEAEKIFVDRAMEISEQIETMLEQKALLQKDFALLLNKSEAEISKWLSGTHNFTLKTLSLIESVLHEEVILTKVGIDLKTKHTSNREGRIIHFIRKPEIPHGSNRTWLEADLSSNNKDNKQPQLKVA